MEYLPYLIVSAVAFAIYNFLSSNTAKPTLKVQEDDRTTPFTIEQIRQYDGKEGRRCYIGLNGFVFDVSTSDSFKNGGSYANFGGHDISIACSQYSTDDKWLDQVYDPSNHDLKFD